MMKKLLLTTAGLIFAAGMAMAGVTADQLVAAYQSQGYTTIEVTTGVNQIKVEAVTGTTKVEVIYDIATGNILTQERHDVAAEAGNHGVEVKTAAADFTEPGSHDATEDTPEDASGDDHGGHGASDAGHDAGDDTGTDDADADDDSSSGSGSGAGGGSESEHGSEGGSGHSLGHSSDGGED